MPQQADRGNDRLIIAVAPNGARKVKRDHPNVPLTVDEIARDAASCKEAGAAVIHVHVRDPSGKHTLDVELYRAATQAIRREAGSELLIQPSTEAVGFYSPDQQIDMVRRLRPEAFSISVRELFSSPEHELAAARFLDEQSKSGVLVQHVVYDNADADLLASLIGRGLVPQHLASILFVLGNRTSAAKLRDMHDLPWGRGFTMPWFVCAFGGFEARCALIAISLGGHARVGFENNLHRPDGSLAESNAELVKVVAKGAALVGRTLADGAAARTCLRMPLSSHG